MYLPYWDYFLSIESDLAICTRYIEFTHTNYKTYSIELARIIMAAAAEVDNLCKDFCNTINPQHSAKNITEYADLILKTYPKMKKMEIILPDYNIYRKPFYKWQIGKSPKWWKNYNSIKHNRKENYSNANLLTAIDTVGGLLILLLYYYYERNNKTRMDIEFGKIPKIINLSNCTTPVELYPGKVVWNYALLF